MQLPPYRCTTSTPRSHVERLWQQAQVDALCQATPFWWVQVFSVLSRMPYLVLLDSEVLLSQTNHLFRTWSAILIGCLDTHQQLCYAGCV